MKKLFYLGMALCLALVGCTNDDLAIQPVATELKATVETSPQSRVGFDFDENAPQGKKWSFYWHQLDEIWVNGYLMYTEDPDKTTSATFKAFGVNVASGYAVYPYHMAKSGTVDHVNNNEFTLAFPSTYDYETNVDNDYFVTYRDVPMYAVVDKGTASFKHLGALLLIRFNGWDKTGEQQLKLTTSKEITGDFTANLTDETPMFMTAEESVQDQVTIDFERPSDAGKSDMVFYVPLPVGKYDLHVSISQGDRLLFSSETYKDVDITRAKFARLVYGESVLVGGSGDYKTATTLDDVTSETLTTEKDELTIKVDEVKANGTNSVTLPESLDAETVTFSIASVEDGSNITINDAEGGNFTGKIIFEVPVGETIPELNANVPEGEVYIKQGNVLTLAVSAHSNTTIIGTGVTVTNLIVKKGNVRIEEGGSVENIEISSENVDGATFVTYEGAEAQTVAYVTTAEGFNAAIEKSADEIIFVNDITSASPLKVTCNTTIDGNDHKLNYTGQDRAIEMPSVIENATDLNVTIKNLTVENTASYCNRGINYNANGKLILENVTVNGENTTYALNFPGKSDNAEVTITNCTATGHNTLNVWGANMKIDVVNSTLTSVDQTSEENYAAIFLNNDGSMCAEGTVITVTGGSVVANDENGEPSSAVLNNTETGKVEISTTTAVTGIEKNPVAIVGYGTSDYYACLTFTQAVNKAIDTNGNIRLIKDITDFDADNTILIQKGATLVIDLNNHTVAGISDQTGKNSNMFDVQGTLTVKNGTMTIEHQGENMAWNNSTNVFNVTDGGVLNIENADVKNLGGSDMAFCVHLNNWGEVTLNVENSALEATYIPVRVFNSGPDMNNVTIKNSTLESTAGNRVLWVHNFSLADFGNDANKQAAAEERLNFTIYNQGNTFKVAQPEANRLIEYGFTNPYNFDEVGTLVADKADELVYALEKKYNVKMISDIKIDPANMSNAYGKTGINVKYGQAIDGGNYTLDIAAAGGTWDSGINTTGGLIKNIKVTGSFRGIFINHNSDYSEKVVLENVTTENTTYTISCDQGMNQDLEATGCTFNGWTSFAATIGNVTFTGCYFNEGNGYAYCRPYAPTSFVGCYFQKGFKVDCRAACTFENCYLDDVLITADNLSELVTSSNLDNASVK